jgi:hypothetical protein
VHEDFFDVINNIRPAPAARLQLALLAATMVVRWFKHLDAVFMMFELFCTAVDLL